MSADQEVTEVEIEQKLGIANIVMAILTSPEWSKTDPNGHLQWKVSPENKITLDKLFADWLLGPLNGRDAYLAQQEEIAELRRRVAELEDARNVRPLVELDLDEQDFLANAGKDGYRKGSSS